jgi:hypothetical protein
MGMISRLRRTPVFVLLQMLVRLIPFRPIDIGRLCFLRYEGRPTVPAGMLRGAAQVRLATPADVDALNAAAGPPRRVSVALRARRPLYGGHDRQHDRRL